jgi:hypothetical protein
MEKTTKLLLSLSVIGIGIYIGTRKNTPSPQEKKDYVPNALVGGVLVGAGLYFTYKSI